MLNDRLIVVEKQRELLNVFENMLNDFYAHAATLDSYNTEQILNIADDIDLSDFDTTSCKISGKYKKLNKTNFTITDIDCDDGCCYTTYKVKVKLKKPIKFKIDLMKDLYMPKEILIKHNTKWFQLNTNNDEKFKLPLKTLIENSRTVKNEFYLKLQLNVKIRNGTKIKTMQFTNNLSFFDVKVDSNKNTIILKETDELEFYIDIDNNTNDGEIFDDIESFVNSIEGVSLSYSIHYLYGGFKGTDTSSTIIVYKYEQKLKRLVDLVFEDFKVMFHSLLEKFSNISIYEKRYDFEHLKSGRRLYIVGYHGTNYTITTPVMIQILI